MTPGTVSGALSGRKDVGLPVPLPKSPSDPRFASNDESTSPTPPPIPAGPPCCIRRLSTPANVLGKSRSTPSNDLFSAIQVSSDASALRFVPPSDSTPPLLGGRLDGRLDGRLGMPDGSAPTPTMLIKFCMYDGSSNGDPPELPALG